MTAATRPRAVCVVTGSELVRGERTDLNGPFLARQALAHGLEPARIAIVGDSPAELETTLRDALDAACAPKPTAWPAPWRPASPPAATEATRRQP